jgi:hypothetical protein
MNKGDEMKQRIRAVLIATLMLFGLIGIDASPAAAAPLPTEFACAAFLPHGGDSVYVNGSSYSASANGWRCRAYHSGSATVYHYYMVCHFPDEPSPSYTYWWNPGFEAFHNWDCTP